MIKLLLLFYLNSYAQNSVLEINGQAVQIENIKTSGVSVTAATLKQSQSLKIGRNKITNLPAGTRLSFFFNFGVKSNLILRGLIVTKAIPNQFYDTANDKRILLNCGRIKSSVAFVEFDESGELLSGCRAAKTQDLQPPNQTTEITVDQNSSIRFFANGLLRSASSASGVLEIQENKIHLHPSSSLDFHANKNIHFFQPAIDESFFLRTQLSDKTGFHQPLNKNSYAVVFHPNAQVSTAWLMLEDEQHVDINAFGSDLLVKIKDGPTGFDVAGEIDRLVLNKTTLITVAEPTYIRSTEQSTGAVSLGLFKPGMQLVLLSTTQLFLKNFEKNTVLMGYPEHGQHGLVFFNELSSTPFN